MEERVKHLTSEIENISKDLQEERNEKIIFQGRKEIAQIQSEINSIKFDERDEKFILENEKNIFRALSSSRERLKKSIEQSTSAISSLEYDEKQYLEELQKLTENKSFQPKTREQTQLEQDLEKIRGELKDQRSILEFNNFNLQDIEMQLNRMLSEYGISREQPTQQQPIQQQQIQQIPVQQTPVQPATNIQSNNSSRLYNLKTGVQNMVKKRPLGKKQTDKLKIRIGGVISAELDGKTKSIGMSYYTNNIDDDTKVLKLFKKLGFDDKTIDTIWKDVNRANGDVNVVKTLLDSSQDGMQAVRYLNDYLDVLKGNKRKLETFSLEYNLRDKSKFDKEEWKKFKQVALDSRDFAKVKGKNMYLLAMKIANFKPIKIITWPFRKSFQAIKSRREQKMISDGSQNAKSLKEKLVSKIEPIAPKVNVNEEKAQKAAQQKAETRTNENEHDAAKKFNWNDQDFFL